MAVKAILVRIAHQPDVDTITRVATALGGAFPKLKINGVRALAVGFGSITVETADGLIFRVARTERAGEGHAMEAALLPLLRDRLPVAIPHPRWRAPAGTPGLPFGALGYERLDGRPASPAHAARPAGIALAHDIADFLHALHRISLDEGTGVRLRTEDRHGATFATLRASVMPLLRERLTGDGLTVVERWCDTVERDELLDHYTPVLRHGDFWYGNLLVDEHGRLTGVLDWEASALGDAATDLARQLHLGDRFARTAIARYVAQAPPDPTLEHRIRRRWELLEFAGICEAATLNDPGELDETIEKLRRGPILTEHANAG